MGKRCDSGQADYEHQEWLDSASDQEMAFRHVRLNPKGTEVMKEAIRAMVAGLSVGDRQFMVNHAWKHYKAAPQKLHEYLPKSAWNPILELKVGDIVRVKYKDANQLEVGQVCQVLRVDTSDEELPYAVSRPIACDMNNIEWCKPDQLKVIREFTN